METSFYPLAPPVSPPLLCTYRHRHTYTRTYHLPLEKKRITHQLLQKHFQYVKWECLTSLGKNIYMSSSVVGTIRLSTKSSFETTTRNFSKVYDSIITTMNRIIFYMFILTAVSVSLHGAPPSMLKEMITDVANLKAQMKVRLDIILRFSFLNV